MENMIFIRNCLEDNTIRFNANESAIPYRFVYLVMKLANLHFSKQWSLSDQQSFKTTLIKILFMD